VRHYDEPVTTSSVRPVVLRNGVGIEDPLSVVLDFLQAYGRLDISGPAQPAAFGEPDLRLANRGGAVVTQAIGEVEWVEVDNHSDLQRARDIAGRC